MRKNSLLYSDHIDIEEPIEYEAPPQNERSWLFYLIVIANSLLVLFVLGIIWFLFLKSPNFQIKAFTDKLFGTGSVTTSQTISVSPQSPNMDEKADRVQPPGKQEQEAVQQIRLKQMREQEELAERQRLEKIRSDSAKTENAGQAIEQKTSTDEITPPALTFDKAIPLAAPSTEAAAKPHAAGSQPEDSIANEEPAIVPNAASETLIPQTNTVDSQMNQIMETMKQQEKETGNQPLNDSRAPADIAPKANKPERNLTTNTEQTINHRLIEKQLDALIETEALKSEAAKLLQQAEELDKKIRINQKLSILQANAV